MMRIIFGLVCAILLVPISHGQQVKPEKPNEQSDLKAALSFELPFTGNMPGGWGGGPPETIFMDNTVAHGGRGAVRIERTSGSPNNFSTITKSIEMDFSGASVELRGFLRTEDVSDFAGLWMREDGESSALAFDNMQSRQLKGTTGWSEYSISLPVRSEARKLFFGFLLSGTGKAWVDGLQLLADGKPVWEAPKVERPTTVVERDHQFAARDSPRVSDRSGPARGDHRPRAGRAGRIFRRPERNLVHHYDRDTSCPNRRGIPEYGNREACRSRHPRTAS